MGRDDGNWTHLPKVREIVDRPYLARASLWLPLDGRVHFLVHSLSNSCYLGFQSTVLVAIRAA